MLDPVAAPAPVADARIWRAAQDFEAMALNQLLAPVFATVDGAHGLFGGGDGEASWKPLLVQELARNISRAGGLGLAVPVYHQMLRMQEAGPPPKGA